MVFNFEPNRQLTAFGYELNKAQKEKLKSFHFVHIAKTSPDGQLVYQTFPRLTYFTEFDTLKSISQKIFRTLKGAVLESMPELKQGLGNLSENEMYQRLFTNQGGDPYEMVLVLGDDSRWKLDPAQTKRLNQLVNAENIVRFEAIFPQIASFEAELQSFVTEIDREVVCPLSQSLKDLETCLKRFLRGHQSPDPCSSCLANPDYKSQQQAEASAGASQGTMMMQHSFEITRTAIYLCFWVKNISGCILGVPLHLDMERFLPRTIHDIQTEYKLVGVILEGNQETWVRNSFENCLVKFTFGEEPDVSVTPMMGQRELLDSRISLVLYQRKR